VACARGEPQGATHPRALGGRAVESQPPGKAVTFYLPIFEYEDDERVRTETATTALTDVSLDGEFIIRDHLHLVWPEDLGVERKILRSRRSGKRFSRPAKL